TVQLRSPFDRNLQPCRSLAMQRGGRGAQKALSVSGRPQLPEEMHVALCAVTTPTAMGRGVSRQNRNFLPSAEPMGPGCKGERGSPEGQMARRAPQPLSLPTGP